MFFKASLSSFESPSSYQVSDSDGGTRNVILVSATWAWKADDIQNEMMYGDEPQDIDEGRSCEHLFGREVTSSGSVHTEHNTGHEWSRHHHEGKVGGPNYTSFENQPRFRSVIERSALTFLSMHPKTPAWIHWQLSRQTDRQINQLLYILMAATPRGIIHVH